jgi:hypothetical protein
MCGRRFAGRSTAWPGDGSKPQAIRRAATTDQRLTVRGSATKCRPVAESETRVVGAAQSRAVRADELRVRVEAAQQRAGAAEAAAEAAQIGLAEAEADTAELRQAEAARQGRGRLARLRAAWRGG